jgi:hypothetical protein
MNKLFTNVNINTNLQNVSSKVDSWPDSQQYSSKKYSPTTPKQPRYLNRMNSKNNSSSETNATVPTDKVLNQVVSGGNSSPISFVPSISTDDSLPSSDDSSIIANSPTQESSNTINNTDEQLSHFDDSSSTKAVAADSSVNSSSLDFTHNFGCSPSSQQQHYLHQQQQQFRQYQYSPYQYHPQQHLQQMLSHSPALASELNCNTNMASGMTSGAASYDSSSAGSSSSYSTTDYYQMATPPIMQQQQQSPYYIWQPSYQPEVHHIDYAASASQQSSAYYTHPYSYYDATTTTGNMAYSSQLLNSYSPQQTNSQSLFTTPSPYPNKQLFSSPPSASSTSAALNDQAVTSTQSQSSTETPLSNCNSPQMGRNSLAAMMQQQPPSISTGPFMYSTSASCSPAQQQPPNSCYASPMPTSYLMYPTPMAPQHQQQMSIPPPPLPGATPTGIPQYNSSRFNKNAYNNPSYKPRSSSNRFNNSYNNKRSYNKYYSKQFTPNNTPEPDLTHLKSPGVPQQQSEDDQYQVPVYSSPMPSYINPFPQSFNNTPPSGGTGSNAVFDQNAYNNFVNAYNSFMCLGGGGGGGGNSGYIESYGGEDEDENADLGEGELACETCHGRRMCFCYYLKVRYYKFPSFMDLMHSQFKKMLQLYGKQQQQLA